jgi:hypothetical protein
MLQRLFKLSENRTTGSRELQAGIAVPLMITLLMATVSPTSGT